MQEKTKAKWRKYGVFICSLLLTIFIYFKGYLKEGQLIKQITEVNNALDLSQKDLGIQKIETVKWKDRYNVVHIRSEKLRVDFKVLEATSVEQARLLSIKPKQVEATTIVTTETVFKNKFDTLYRDNYIYIEKVKDSILVALNDTMVFTEYWKRTWFLGRKKHYTDLSNKNPYIKLTGLKTIEAKGKTPTIILGPSLSYDIFRKSPVIGVSILYYPLTLKL